MFPPSSLIWAVTTASPIHTIENTPANTWVFCESLAEMLSKVLSVRQNINGPQRSQSPIAPGPLPAPPPPNPVPDSRTSFAFGHFLNVNFGQRTAFIFSHTAKMSRDSVLQTDSSRVLVGARRSSPGMAEVRWVGFNGVVAEAASSGSSSSISTTRQ